MGSCISWERMSKNFYHVDKNFRPNMQYLKLKTLFDQI